MRGTSRRATVVLVVLALAIAACSDDADPGADSDPEPTATTAGADATPTTPAPATTVPPRPPDGACDPVDPVACLLPWPNDRFTRLDDATATGLRIDLPVEGMPANADEVPIAVGEWNRNDGFSPASIPMTVIPGVDLVQSALPPVTDIERSLDEDSTLVLFDVDLGARIPAWVELDSEGTEADRTPLLVVPATALLEGHRHVVAFRDLVDAGGAAIAPVDEYVARLAEPDAHTAALVEDLASAGLDADELVTAWSFTVASGESISARLRHMWQETAAELGTGAPPFTIDSAEQEGLATIVQGTFETPSYLTGDGSTGSVFDNEGDPDGIPTRNGTLTSEFVCTVPLSATGDQPSGFVLYGHGLLGSRTEALGIGSVGAAAGIGFCALDWIGMSTTDVPTVIASLTELTSFRSLPDRLQQGHLAWLLLGRLLASDAGFATDPAFQDASGASLIAHDRLSFLGASQGGILGGVPSALATDWEQVILAVPGLGYNLLIPRSIDFDEFAPILDEAYPDPLDRRLIGELMEMLWDRGENAGWAQHVTADTYDGAPEKNVLILEAFGDHQVANVSTEKLARTLGVPRLAPTLEPGRSTDVDPFFGIPEIPTTPHQGSGLIVWDFGTPAPPTENVPPRAGEDPHGKLADVPEALEIVAAFIEPDGVVIDRCGGQPCQTLPE